MRVTTAAVVLLAGACGAKAKSQPTSAACQALWKKAPSVASDTPFGHDWFAPRCELAGASSVSKCMDACEKLPERRRGLCWALTGSGCVQQAATRAAMESGKVDEALTRIRQGALTTDGSPITLGGQDGVLTLLGRAWAAKRADHTLVYLPFWQGRQSNTAGFLYRAPAWPETGKSLPVPGLPFEAADGRRLPTKDEPEAFTVAERINDHWLVVHYGWD